MTVPTEHARFSYSFDELSEAAQTRAIEAIANKLSGDWWDEGNVEEVGGVILFKFAESIGADLGEADFPGIQGVKLGSWSASYVQGDYVGFSGRLTRDNAPSLPWIDGVDHVTLEEGRSSTSIWFAMGDNAADGIDVSPIRESIQAALHEALQAGYRQVDYIGSEENARFHIETGDHEFNIDGKLL